ncbi:hypothetical protein VTL71DRAFT_6683 [Oculimacula yallundae]|uniref:BTB domain-containing protein n=1 Tax=Oculimacula yallundae TaxID=86028 RepID=A0ABR4BYK1_9HELO
MDYSDEAGAPRARSGMGSTRTTPAPITSSTTPAGGHGKIPASGHGSREKARTPGSSGLNIARSDANIRQPVSGMVGGQKGSGLNQDDRNRLSSFGYSSSIVQDEERGGGRFTVGGQSFAPTYPQDLIVNESGLERYVRTNPQSGANSAPGDLTGMANGRLASHIDNEPYYNGTNRLPPLSSASTFFPPDNATVVPSIYPQFSDADVRITTPSGHIWKLHSVVLSKASPVLAMLLASTPPLSSHRRLKDDKAIKWDIKLVADNRAQDIDPQGLNFMSFHKINVKEKGFYMFANYNGLGEGTGFDKLYDNFFRCIYNMEPTFTQDSHRLGSGSIYDATLLLQAATWLEAVPCVRLIIEANLLRLHQLLWKHIGERPEGWIHVAAQLQSPLIFRESIIHLVGKFHLKNGINEQFLRKKSHGPMTEKIWALIVQKAKELKDKKLLVERVLLEFYPPRMTHKEDDDSVPGRTIYTADIYLWQAITVFRQFIASAFHSNFHHKAKDGGLAFYRTLGAADPSYLRPDTLEKFHQNFDMSIKARGLLVAALDQIKKEARFVVAELLHDRSQLVRGPNDQPRDHLTCTEILDQEMPWVAALPGSGDGESIAGVN